MFKGLAPCRRCRAARLVFQPNTCRDVAPPGTSTLQASTSVAPAVGAALRALFHALICSKALQLGQLLRLLSVPAALTRPARLLTVAVLEADSDCGEDRRNCSYKCLALWWLIALASCRFTLFRINCSKRKLKLGYQDYGIWCRTSKALYQSGPAAWSLRMLCDRLEL